MTWDEARHRELLAAVGVSVLRDPATLAAATEDFGRIVRGNPSGVAEPRTADEVLELVRFAQSRGLRLTSRGRGLSQSGQSIAPSGALSVDLRRLDRVGEPDTTAHTISCEPGARWSAVLARAGAVGLMPHVHPLNLDLTIGGTLSVGGVGASSHRFGPAAAHVRELEVVTGEPRRVRCGPSEERALFEAVRCGLGRVGVMTRIKLSLRPFRPLVRTFHLLYDDYERWMADQRAVQSRCDYLEGFFCASVQGLRRVGAARRPFAVWLYGLQISFEHEPGEEPSAGDALDGLLPYRVVHTQDEPTLEFAARYAPRFALMQRTGAWTQQHPWLECLVPLDGAATLPSIVEELPLFLGDGHRLMLVSTEVELPRFFITPPSAGAGGIGAFAVLPVGVPPAFATDAREAIAAAHRRLISAGGRRYLSGWLGMMDAAAWEQHFGERLAEWIAVKQQFDPSTTFVSSLGCP